MPTMPPLQEAEGYSESQVGAMNSRLAHHIADVVVLRLQANLTSMEKQLATLTDQVQKAHRRPSFLGWSQHRSPSTGLLSTVSEQRLPSVVEQRLAASSASSLTEQRPASKLAAPMLNKTKEVDKVGSARSMRRGYSSLGRADSGQSSDDEDKTKQDSRAFSESELPHGTLASCVDSDTYGYISLMVILANTAFVWVVTDYSARTLKPEVTWMLVAEFFFLTYYTVEVALKLFVHGCQFFCNDDWGWNSFDCIVVVSGIFQAFVEEFLDVQSMDLTFLRVCRILRITRILRVFKAVRFFTELRLMASCLVGSLGSLFWVSVFLFLMLMMVALVFVQGMTNFRIENGICDHGPCQQIPALFGSVVRTMRILFECTTGGTDWGDIYEVVELTGEFNTALFVFYIVFFLFAFFNIIMSLFVDKAMKLATPDEYIQMMECREQELKLCKGLRELLEELDVNESGTISLLELDQATESEEIVRKFDEVGLSVLQAKVFFQTLAGAAHEDELFISDFVDACIKMKGPAWGIDVQAISFQLKALQAHHGLLGYDGRF